MRYGGHETFHIREGWLAKGLTLLKGNPSLLSAEFAEDHLGVGRNMAKSIRHWLVASGIALRTGTRKSFGYEVTPVGQLIAERDPHFLELDTWWLIHLNLIHSLEHARSWSWFFGEFGMKRFERSVCVESLRRFLRNEGSRLPSPRTLDRDLGCLLGSYARRMPPEDSDPEDSVDCPLQDLGLLTHFSHSGNYRLEVAHRQIPFPLFAYSIVSSPDFMQTTGRVDCQFSELLSRKFSPARCFVIDADSLLSLLQRYADESRIRLDYVAGDRVVSFKSEEPRDYARETLEAAETAHA